MSVRPITISEERQAYGVPWQGWLGFFGATQGFLTHLRLNNLRLNGPWMSTAAARLTLPLFVVGGAATGVMLGAHFFGDAELRRLH